MSTHETAAQLPAANVPERLGAAGRTALRLLNRYSFGFALLLSLVLLAITLIHDSNFGWSDQLANFAPMAIAAMASTPAIIAGGGGLDLTISPLMYLAGEVFIIYLVPHSLGGAVSVPLLLALGLGVGFVTGLVIILLRVPPVVVTLSMYFILIGVDLRVAPNAQYLSGDNWIKHLAADVGPFPGALIPLAFPFVVWYLLGLTPYKRTLYAVGSNDATAFSSGVNVAAVRVVAYAVGGMFAAVGGAALVALTSSANPSLSTTYTLIAIASVALGGTSLWGGRGGLLGPMLGAASIYLLGNLLITLQVDPSYLQVMYGTMLVFAVVLSGVATRSKVAA
jgi:ribose transport system permease protein